MPIEYLREAADMTDAEIAELKREQDDVYSYRPPFLYETITYTGEIYAYHFSLPGALGNNKVTDWRTPFETLPPSHYAEPAECLPDTTWFNAGTYPSMFERETLGPAFTLDAGEPKETWVLRPTRNGMYRLKFRCGYYAARFAPPGQAVIQLKIPLHFCLYMMRTSVGRLSTMTLADIDMTKLGTYGCQQILLSTTPAWSACYKVSDTIVIPTYTEPLPYVEILVRLSVGEEIMPCVGFLADYTKNHQSWVDPGIKWTDVLGGPVIITALVVKSDQAVIKTAEVPSYTTDTSFGYELLD